jgi:inhibitor of cysteine peptidase
MGTGAAVLTVWHGFLGIALLALLASAAPSRATDAALVTLTEADDGRVISLSRGGTFAVRLKENLSTGYRWSVEEPLDGALALESATSIGAQTPMPGAGGEALFRIKLVGAGPARLALKYGRPWEGDASVARRFSVTVQAR